MNMKLRYRLFLRRKSVYYAFDDTTKTFTSPKESRVVHRLLHYKLARDHARIVGNGFVNANLGYFRESVAFVN